MRELIKKGVLYGENLSGGRQALLGFAETAYYVRKGNTLTKIGRATLEMSRGRDTQYNFESVRVKSYPFSEKENKVFQITKVM